MDGLTLRGSPTWTCGRRHSTLITRQDLWWYSYLYLLVIQTFAYGGARELNRVFRQCWGEHLSVPECHVVLCIVTRSSRSHLSFYILVPRRRRLCDKQALYSRHNAYMDFRVDRRFATTLTHLTSKIGILIFPY